jgi:hypothetical protein
MILGSGRYYHVDRSSIEKRKLEQSGDSRTRETGVLKLAKVVHTQ